MADGTGAVTDATNIGYQFLNDGGNGTTSKFVLFTLNSTWSSTQKFAFETTFYSDNGNSAAYCALWDITSNVIVNSSQVSTRSATATVVRSGQFSLTPNHSYGVTFSINNSSYAVGVSDASLVVFGS